MDPLQQLMAQGQPYQAGDMARNMPRQQPSGVLETLKGMFGNEPWSAGGALSAMMSAVPGTGRPTGTIPKSVQPYRANNYAEPPVAANAIKPFEHERFRRQLERLLPITPENEAQAQMLRSRMREVEALPQNNYWGESPSLPQKPNPLTADLDQMYGAISPQERARLLGIKVVE